MQIEELQVKFTAQTADFKKKTDEMVSSLEKTSQECEKSQKKLKEAMKSPSEKVRTLAGELKSLQAEFRKESDAIFKSQDKIEQYDRQMQKLSETHKAQLADTDKARQHLEELKEQYDGVKQVIEQFGMKTPLSTQLEEAKRKTEELGGQMDSLFEEIENSKALGYSNVNSEDGIISIKDAERKLDELNEKVEESVKRERKIKLAIDTFGTDKPGEKLKELESDVNKAQASFSRLEQKSNKTYSEMAELAEKAANENKKIESSQPSLKKLHSEIGKASSKLSKMMRLSKIGTSLSSGFTKAKNALGKFVSTANSGVKKVATHFSSVIDKMKSAGSHTASLAQKFKKLSAIAGGLMLLKSAFSKLKDISSEYVDSSEQLKAKTDGMKKAFGQALAPAIETAISAFEKMIPYILTALELLSKLLVKLMSLAGLKQTASTLSSVAKSTKEVADAQNELYGFDKITKQSDDKNSSTDTPSVKYEPAELGSWADRIKNAIENGDWASVGTVLGEKVNSLVDKVNFSSIGSKIGKSVQAGLETVYSFLDTVDFGCVGSGIAESLNSIMDNVDFTLAGKTLAKKWTVITDTVSGFVNTFDFKNFGTSVSDTVNGWFSEIDFAKAAQTLSASLTGILTSIDTALENINWQDIGKKCAEFLRNIDYSEIVSGIFEGIGAALGGIAGFLDGLFDGVWDDVKTYFGPYIEGAGGNIISGVLQGIGDALTDIGTWIKTNILDPFLKGFKEAFGIHSPSTVMAEMGGYLIDGLKNGVGDIWKKVKEKFTDLWTNITSWFDGKKEKMSEKWKKLTSGIKDVKANIKASFSDKVADIKGKWKNRTDEIKDKRGSLKASFADTVKDVRDKWKKRTDEIKGKTETISMKLSDGVTSVIKSVINGIVNILNKAIDAINKVLPSSLKIGKIDPPKLASGTVVPKNFGETPVIVGDNKREIEVVSPLSVIKRAVYEVVGSADGSDTRPQTLVVPVYIGNKKVSETVIDDINKKTSSTGVCPIKV